MLTLPHLCPGVGTPSGWLLAAFWRDHSSPVTSWFLTQVCGQTLPISFHTPRVSRLSKNLNVFSRKLHEFTLVLLMVKVKDCEVYNHLKSFFFLFRLCCHLDSWLGSFALVSYKNIPWLQRQSFISRCLQRWLLHPVSTHSAQWHS